MKTPIEAIQEVRAEAIERDGFFRYNLTHLQIFKKMSNGSYRKSYDHGDIRKVTDEELDFLMYMSLDDIAPVYNRHDNLVRLEVYVSGL